MRPPGHMLRNRAMTRFALWGLIVAKLIGGWGVKWDIEWHVRVQCSGCT